MRGGEAKGRQPMTEKNETMRRGVARWGQEGYPPPRRAD